MLRVSFQNISLLESDWHYTPTQSLYSAAGTIVWTGCSTATDCRTLEGAECIFCCMHTVCMGLYIREISFRVFLLTCIKPHPQQWSSNHSLATIKAGRGFFRLFSHAEAVCTGLWSAILGDSRAWKVVSLFLPLQRQKHKSKCVRHRLHCVFVQSYLRRNL